MKDNRTSKFHGKAQLRLEYFTHLRRNLTHLQAVKSYFTDTETRIGLKRTPQPRQRSTAFDGRRLPQTFPRMHTDEVTPDQELSDRRIAAGNMAVRISQPSKPSKPNQT